MRSILLVFIVILHAMPAFAIVDVHDEYYAKPELDTFSVFDFSFSGATGNKEELDFDLDTHSIIRRNKTTWMLVAATSFAETNGQESKNDLFFHGRYTRHFKGNEKHGFDLLAQYGRDKFERLQRRLVIGGGYRYEWKEGSTNERGLMGIGLIREHERYFGLSSETRTWRGNFYVTAAIPIPLPQGASFTFSGYLQPDLGNFSNLRSVTVFGLKAQLSNRLAVKASVDQEYYFDRAPGIEKNNITYSTGISYTLF